MEKRKPVDVVVEGVLTEKEGTEELSWSDEGEEGVLEGVEGLGPIRRCYHAVLIVVLSETEGTG